MKPEQAALIKKAWESVNAAVMLSENDYFDFAASRAYYAMFYIAEAFLLGDGLSFSKHSAVISAFGKEFAKTGRVPSEFHRYLIESENSRIVGDYDLYKGLKKEDAEIQIERARKFMELADKFIK